MRYTRQKSGSVLSELISCMDTYQLLDAGRILSVFSF